MRRSSAELPGDEGFKVPGGLAADGTAGGDFRAGRRPAADEREVLIANGLDPDAILAQAAVYSSTKCSAMGSSMPTCTPGTC